MQDYKLLDTSKFEGFLSKSSEWNNEYKRIQDQYDEIVKFLESNWKGRGADAFVDDAKKIKTNIVGIGDALKTMCDILSDCEDILSSSDTSIGKLNQEI